MELDSKSRDSVIRTLYGEARGEGDRGMIAVAHVIKNRTLDKRWPNTGDAVVRQKWQFSSWNVNDANYKKILALKTNDRFYIHIGNIVDAVWNEVADPTNGAVYYYAPAGMPGGKAPKWWPSAVAESDGQIQIGNQFFAGKVHAKANEYVAESKTVAKSTASKPRTSSRRSV